MYAGPIRISTDTVLRAVAVMEDDRRSVETRAEYRFALKDMTLESPTRLDSRAVFYGGGMRDLLKESRATCDYLDGQWRGTLDDIDVTCVLPEETDIASISMGFLTHHRSGIVYPERMELYVGPDKEHMTLFDTLQLPAGPEDREIRKRDFGFEVHARVGAFRLVARRYARMPQWCTYRGTPTVFTMTDALIVIPE